MMRINISITDELRRWCEARVAGGCYSSISDYVRALIRSDQEEALKLARLRAEIDKGRDSGISERTLDDIVEGRQRASRKGPNG